MSSMVQATFGSAVTAASSSHIGLAARLSQDETRGNGLVAELRGVPKRALMAVLGSDLGERVWRHARGKARWPEGAISDAEIAAGLVGHLCRQAAAELRRAKKHAKFVRLTVWLDSGRAATGRTRLPRLTQDSSEIATAAQALLHTFELSPALVYSINLDVTAIGGLVGEPYAIPAWLPAAQLADA